MDGKLDLKVFVMPAMMLLSRKIPFMLPNPAYICTEDDPPVCPDPKGDIPKELPNEELIQQCQIGLVTIVVVLFSVLFYVYQRVQSKAAQKTIWVPPKAQPKLPFGLGPAAKEVTKEDFTETTMATHESNMVKEAAQGMILPVGIAFFMSMRMNVHLSLVMQMIMLPMNMYDNLVFKKYVMGATKNADGQDAMYDELTEAPSDALIKEMNDKIAAEAAEADTTKTDDAAITDKSEPRVEELPDAKKEEEKKMDVKDID